MRLVAVLLGAFAGLQLLRAQSIGDDAQLWACNASSPTQLWLVETSNDFPYAHITLSRSRDSTTGLYLVLDIGAWSNKTGAEVHVWQNSTGAKGYNEQWAFSGRGNIISKMNSFCLSSAASTAGSRVAMQPCGSVASALQNWTYEQGTGLIRSTARPDLCLDAGSSANCSMAPFNGYTYCNPSAPVESRIADLVSRIEPFDYGQLLGNRNNGLPALGVPQIRFGECLHGAKVQCGAPYTDPATGYTSTGCPTSFPHLLLIGGTLNRTLWTLMATAVGDEDRGLYNQGIGASIFWAPDVNPFRDPRWGRGQEVAGEDPTLLAEFAAIYVAALQGEGGPDPIHKKVVATCKHFSAYDVENSDGHIRSAFNAIVPSRDLISYYWPPFQSCVQRAKAGSIMCSYNAVNGVPSCANGVFQNAVVRQQWGWDGFFVTDCGALADIYTAHNYTASWNETVRAAMQQGGTDAECDDVYAQYLAGAYQAGYVNLTDMQRSGSNVLRQVFSLGLLDPASSSEYNTYGPERVDTALHRQLAYEAALQGIVLLQNNVSETTVVPNAGAAPILPIPRSALGGRTVALVGPLAAATQTLLSNYHGQNKLVEDHSILAALSREGPPNYFFVDYAPGCVDAVGNVSVACNTQDGFQDAIESAINSKLVIVVVGLCSDDCPSADDEPAREGEGKDRLSISLPGQQEALIQAMVGTGRPVVVVLVHGGALAIEWTKANVPAIIDAHYPGEMGGDALVSILFGDVSPSGREITTTYTAALTQERNMTDMQIGPHTAGDGTAIPGITYLYYDQPVLWPFGWGLSYTTFEYKWYNSSQFAGTQEVDVQLWAQGIVQAPVYAVNVTNKGKVRSDVSVMAFLSSGQPGEPIRQLFDFQRAAGVEPNATVTLQFTVPITVAARVSEEGVQSLVPGVYAIHIGEVQAVGDAASQYVIGQLRLVGEQEVLFDLKRVEAQYEADLRSRST